MTDDNKRVNEAFMRGYERGKIEALSYGGYITKPIREQVDLPHTRDEIAENDTVYKPTYYNDSKITPFDVIDDWKLDFYLGNVVKYIKRVGKKDGNSRLQDLKKIRTYIDEEIKREEASGK